MVLNEEKLREIVKGVITSILREGFADDDIDNDEIVDDFDFDNAEPTDDDIVGLEDIVTAGDTSKKRFGKNQRMNKLRDRFAKQGYKGERLEQKARDAFDDEEESRGADEYEMMHYFDDEPTYFGGNYIYESIINNAVSHGIRKVLNEVSGWNLEKDDVTWVNDSETGLGKPWMVRLWTGSGYYLPAFGAYANSEQDALEEVVAYLDKEGNTDFFADDVADADINELIANGYTEEEANEAPEFNESYLYVDATMAGASRPHYVWLENLSVYPYDEKRFKS